MPRLAGRPSTAGAFLGVGAVVVMLLAAAFVTGAVSPQEHPDGESVLERVHDRYAAAETVVGNATVTATNATTTLTATVEFAFAAENRSRIVVTHDGDTYRAGSNGTVVWVVQGDHVRIWPIDDLRGQARPVHDRTEPGVRSPPAEALRNASRMAWRHENHSATYVESTSVDGTPAHIVDLTHPDRDGEARLWVAERDARLLRAQVTHGVNETTVEFGETRFDVDVHGSTFDPPTDRLPTTSVRTFSSHDAVTDEASIPVPRPAEDWTFEEAIYTRRGDGEAVVSRYVDGDENLTVVTTTLADRGEALVGDLNGSTVAVGDEEATLTTMDDRTVVAWQDDGVTYAVLTEADAAAASSAARSLD